MAHPILPIFPHHIIDDFPAAIVGKIRIDIGQTDPVGIEEAFEDEPVLEGIDVGDPEAVSNKAARRRASPRSHLDAPGAGILDEIGDDQKVARVTHGINDAKLIVKARLYLRGYLPETPRGSRESLLL